MDPALQNFFYTLFLTLHNLSRWLVIVFAGLALYWAYSGWFKKQEWTRSADRAGILFTSIIDLQLLLGLVLYFLFSPATPPLFANFSAAMKSPYNRFFGLEHVAVMVVALILAHATRAAFRRVKDPVTRHRNTAIGFTLTLLVILAAIPWPFMANVARPWFRLFGLAF